MDEPQVPLDGLKFDELPYVEGSPPLGSKVFEKGGKHWVVQAGGRPTMMANYNGVQVPFYQSTNTGGKVETVGGQWYPFFGVDPEEKWINKVDGQEMSDYYGSEELKAIAQHLDKNVGSLMRPSMRRNLDTNEMEPVLNKESGKPEYEIDPAKKLPKSGIAGVENPGPAFEDLLNSSMTHPVATRDNPEGVRKNIDDVKARLSVARLKGARRAAFESGASPSLSTPANEASSAAGSLEAFANRPAGIQEFDSPIKIEGQ